VVIKVQQAPAEHTEDRTARMRRSFAAAGSRHHEPQQVRFGP
jgi:hypothetical protein